MIFPGGSRFATWRRPARDASLSREAGFTLLEVMVALAVLGIAMAGVISAMTQQAKNAGYLKEKTVALWVAHNQLAELQMRKQPPDPGRSDGKVEMGGSEWRWDAVVIKTDDSRLRRVDIEVRRSGAKASTQKDPALAKVTGFLAS